MDYSDSAAVVVAVVAVAAAAGANRRLPSRYFALNETGCEH